jgi:hypothetical protein
MALTAAEQFLLELINRARLDPAAEAARLGQDLNAGLSPGQIGTGAQEVLAHNSLLELAAQRHSTWMIDTDTFSHTGAGGSDPSNRMAAAGYVFAGAWRYGENLAMNGSTGSIDLNTAIIQHYEGLFHSDHHRANTLNAGFREIGLAQVEGRFAQGGNTFNAAVLTENFARSGPDMFVTGVAYTDRDNNDFYGIGEGRADIWIRAGGDQVQTAAAGGYGIGLTAGAAVAVTVGRGAGVLAQLQLDLSTGNGKLDVIADTAGHFSLALSASAVLLSGLGDATLLGVGNLDLTGSAGVNHLTGNRGANLLSDGGGAGIDTLRGMGGNDIYIIHNAASHIVEGAGQGSADRVCAGVSFALAADDNIEIMTTTAASGTAAINLTGNVLMQTITGNAGDNVLHDGGGAADVLRGLGGNDTYRIFDSADQIIEVAGDGTADRVMSAVSFRLSSDDDIEVMTTNGATGATAINLTGNGLTQSITGNAGANRINGAGGCDTLTGGAGADAFVFSTTPWSGNRDVITDFSARDDRIELDDAVFTALGAAASRSTSMATGFAVTTLAAAAFATNTTGLAGDANDRVIYETDTGRLYFDADGSGAGVRLLFATLDTGLGLTVADILII